MSDLNKDLAELETKIKDQEARANRSMTISIAVSAILVVVMLVYFSILGGMLRDAADPAGVATMVSDQVRTQVPVAVKEIQGAIRKEAPKVIDDVANTLINEQMPAYRVKVEDTIKDEALKYLEKHEGTVLDAFDEIFEAHRDRVNAMLTKLTDAQGTKEFEEDLYSIMTEALDEQELRVELDSYAHTLSDVDQMLTILIDHPEALDAQQQSMRNLLALIREMTRRTEVGKIDLSN